MSQKYFYINSDILVEWNYSHSNVSENYYKLTNLSDNKINFISTLNNNSISNTLFCVDSVIKKYTLVDTNKYNILQIQSYNTPPIEYDYVKIYIPTSFDFEENMGFIITIYTKDYYNEKNIYFSEFFYDSSDPIISKMIQFQTPFIYGEREWNRCLILNIPSLDFISKQRTVDSTTNLPIPFTINANMSTIGLSQTSPIIIEMRNITGKETILGTTYYYTSDVFSRSIPKSPEYETLGVSIEESQNGDFFEIYGTYKGTNENMDDFVYSLHVQSKKINIEYTITLYEENIQSGYPIKIKITENFSQKIEYRPILKYSNTTALIDVKMDIIDIYDYSTISRRTTLGLTKNLFKYGKRLSQIISTNLYIPNIYNYKPNSNIIYDNKSPQYNYEITKIPYPVLVEKYKVLVNSSNSIETSDNEFITNGLLTILLTPFDNIIRFQLYKQIDDNVPEPYDLNEITTYGEIMLVFKSDISSIEKNLFYQSDDNNLAYGVIVFKVSEIDINTLKQMRKSGFNNFYIVIKGNNNRTMLYSGKFDIIEDIKFIKYPGSRWTPYIPSNVIQVQENLNNENNVNIQELYDRIVMLESELQMEKLMSANDVRNNENITDRNINVLTTLNNKTSGDIFKENYENRNQVYANYLLFTSTNNESIFINSIFTGINLLMNNYGLSLNNTLYYYNSGLKIIILQSVKKSFMDIYLDNSLSLNPYISSIVKLDIGLGLTDLLNVTQSPVANFTYTPNNLNDGDDVVFRNTSLNTNNTTIYMWSVDPILNYSPSTSSNVDFITTVINTDTEFISTSVTLTVINGIYSDTITKIITVGPSKDIS